MVQTSRADWPAADGGTVGVTAGSGDVDVTLDDGVGTRVGALACSTGWSVVHAANAMAPLNRTTASRIS